MSRPHLIIKTDKGLVILSPRQVLMIRFRAWIGRSYLRTLARWKRRSQREGKPLRIGGHGLD